MPPIEDETVPHEAEHAAAQDAHSRRTSDHAAIADATVAAANPPTKVEYDALVGKFNEVLDVLRDAELIPTP